MQISIVSSSDIESKSKIISAEYYHPLAIKIDKLFHFSDKVLPLRKISDKINDFGSFSLYNNVVYLTDDSKGGIPFLRVVDLTENSIDYENSQKIDLSSNKLLRKSKVDFGDLLYSIIGTLGICCVSTQNISCNSNQSLAKITINDNLANKFYVCAYLNSEIGKVLALRGESGGLQKHITLQRTREIPIYLLSRSIQNKIGDIYKKSIETKENSKKLYQEAEEILLNELELKNLKLNPSLTFNSQKQEIDEAERFDADYFQPKYTHIINKIKRYKNGSEKLSKLVKIEDKNFYPEKEISYKYVALADISSSGEIISYKEDVGEELPTRARRLVREGDVIISSIEGSLNTSTLITKEYEGFICSNGFYVLKSQIFNPETLLILFKSKILIELLKRVSKGTILEGYSKSDLEKIDIPLIDPSIQKQISIKIKQANELMSKSREYLIESKKIIKEEIENIK
jgi:restriction endonuclease S subunit